MSTTTKRQATLDGFDLPNEAYALEASTTYPLSEPTREARGRMGRYARIQLRDFFAKQGAMMAVIAVALTAVAFTGSRTVGMPLAQMIGDTFRSIGGALIGIGTLLAVRGIVSDDTQHGYHRFLFSKPLNIERYYAQSFAVRFVGFMVMLAALLLPFTALATLPLLPMLAIGALFFTLAGGIAFLLSSITRLDMQFLLGIGAVTSLVQGISREPLFAFLRPLARLLPPLDQLREIANYLLQLRDVTWISGWSVAWVIGYGVACFLAGLAIIRRRALTA